MRILIAVIAVCMMIPQYLNAAEASLFVDPEMGVYTIGELFEIKVYADTGGVEANAAEAELTFNADALEVQRISTDDSILDSWPTPPTYSNQTGNIRFAGWTKEPYRGSRGLLVTIQFKALRSRPSNAYLAAGAILAADGRGSNIITSMRSGLYTVEPKEHVPTTDIEEGTTTSRYEVEEALPPKPVLDPHPGVVEVGKKIIVTGVSEPNAKVVFIFGEGDDAESTAVTSDADGTFMFVSKVGARPGVYRLRVMTQNENGKMSKAARLTITAQSEGLAAAAAVSADIAWTIIPILFLLVVGGLGAGYLYHIHTLEKIRSSRSHRRE